MLIAMPKLKIILKQVSCSTKAKLFIHNTLYLLHNTFYD